MNKVKLIITGLLMAFSLASYALSPAEEAIVERIKPVGDVCVTGENCADSSVAVAGDSAASGVDSAADTFGKTCATCHTAGVAGAPKIGSKDDWVPRLAKGKDVLYQNAINGLAPAMPAKGMCFSCSDDELKALVDYMLEKSQ